MIPVAMAERIRQDAVTSYPNEAVWLVTEEGCRQVPNISEDPTKTFRVSKKVMAEAAAMGLLAIVHSHPDYPPCPSESDMLGQIASGVPWGIVATDGTDATELVWFGDQVDAPPIVGRGFIHGVTDCYALIRDYYKQELGITLVEFPRSWEWWLNGKNLYLSGIQPAGFKVIDQSDAMPGDMWIAQVNSPVPNHGGILLDKGLALHHPSSRKPVDPSFLSRREPIGRWLPHIVTWLRHESR